MRQAVTGMQGAVHSCGVPTESDCQLLCSVPALCPLGSLVLLLTELEDGSACVPSLMLGLELEPQTAERMKIFQTYPNGAFPTGSSGGAV